LNKRTPANSVSVQGESCPRRYYLYAKKSDFRRVGSGSNDEEEYPQPQCPCKKLDSYKRQKKASTHRGSSNSVKGSKKEPSHRDKESELPSKRERMQQKKLRPRPHRRHQEPGAVKNKRKKEERRKCGLQGVLATGMTRYLTVAAGHGRKSGDREGNLTRLREKEYE